MDYGKYKKLEFRRKFWRFFGAAIDITDPETEQLVGYIEMKAWKLREDVRVYRDKTKSQEVLRIHARNIIDFGATYDVFDSDSGTPLFYFRRKGLKSTFVRDHWDVFNASDQPIGSIQETSSGLALARRWLGIIPYAGAVAELIFGFVPQTYSVLDTGNNVSATLAHRKNPFIVKFSLDRSSGSNSIDPRVAVSIVSLLAVIDASKN